MEISKPGETQDEASQKPRWLFFVMLFIPLAMILGKLPMFPTSAAFTDWFSLTDVPRHMQNHIEYILFVPLSAVVVAFFRLTLGMPVLSLFRPILTAIAFRIMGIPMGLAFLAVVLGIVVLIRPLLKGAHYYARVPVQLSLVAAFMVLPLMAGKWWHAAWLLRLTYFPIISLALICEAFTKALDEKGPAEAAWPTVNTILVGIIIRVLEQTPGALHLFLRFPELLIAQVGLVLFIAEYLNFGVLEGKNPLAWKSGPPASITPTPSPALENMALAVEFQNRHA